MIRYYCSGFDKDSAFSHGLGDMFLDELKDTKSIVYIPGSPDNLEKLNNKYLPAFTKYFKEVGITFDNVNVITPDFDKKKAKEIVKNASFVMLMGGDPYKQKELCEKLDLLNELKEYKGILLGVSAGAMLMSKYIIITPCSEEYPDFHIEKGLNLDNISIYPHNNTEKDEYPDVLVVDDETYQKEDLLKVAKEYGEFYLLQDNLRKNGKTDVSIIKLVDGKIEFYKENKGKIWNVKKDKITLLKK